MKISINNPDSVSQKQACNQNLHEGTAAAINVADAQTESRPPYAVEGTMVIPWTDVVGTWAAGDSLIVQFVLTEDADSAASAVTT